MTPHYSADWSDDALIRFQNVCSELKCSPIDMASVLYSESGMHADAHNPNGDASGIFQAMPATLKGLGWLDTPAAFRALSPMAQLPYLRRYYSSYVGKLTSAALCYVATFLPALLDKAAVSPPSFVLVAKGGRYGWAYAPNAGFDANHDLTITVGELQSAILRNCRGPRWSEILSRLSGGVLVPIDSGAGQQFDLRSTRGIQTALLRLGYQPGLADGIPGPLTLAALECYQADAGLEPDGIPGPATRSALADALSKLSTLPPPPGAA